MGPRFASVSRAGRMLARSSLRETEGRGEQRIIAVDVSRPSLLIVTPPSGTVTDEALESFILQFDAHICAGRRPYAVVVDLRQSHGLSPAQRQRLTRSMQAHEGHAAAGFPNCGVALVFSSALLRGMLTAMLWMYKPRHESRVFSDLAEAEAWAQSRVSGYLASSQQPEGDST